MLPLHVHKSDWRSYDQIVHHYDRVWAARFQPAAQAMAGMMPAGCQPRALLDIGTGTGIIPAIFSETFKTLQNIAGCDISVCFNKQRRDWQTSTWSPPMPQSCRSKAKRSMWLRPVLFYRIFANIEERSTKYIVF